MIISVAKLRIFSETLAIKRLQKYFQVVDAEDAAVADAAAFAGGKYLYIPPATVKIVSQRDAILQVEDAAVGLPNIEVDRVAGIEHRASGRYVYRASHQENVGLNLSLNIPGEYGSSTLGRLSEKRHVNLTVLSFSSLSEISEV